MGGESKKKTVSAKRMHTVKACRHGICVLGWMLREKWDQLDQLSSVYPPLGLSVHTLEVHVERQPCPDVATS